MLALRWQTRGNVHKREGFGLSIDSREELVREAGVEPTTFGSGGRRSIQLSYSRKSGVSIRAPPFWLKWNLLRPAGELRHGAC